MNPRLIVRQRPDLSLADLQKTMRDGGSVLRSAHFGNWSPSNLAVAAAGLPCVLINTTITGRDTTYHPAGIIAGRRFHPGLVKSGNSLVTLSHVRRTPDVAGLESFFPLGANLAEAHQDALVKAIPQSNIVAYSQYLDCHQGTAAKILEICTQAKPELWSRRADVLRGVEEIDSDYASMPRNGVDWKTISSDGIVGFAGAASGWLIPKAIIILTMAVIEALRYGVNEVYHLSGPSMVHYIGMLDEDLQELYQAVATEMQLPNELEFNLAPTALMTLGAPVTERSSIDRLVESWLSADGARQHVPLPNSAERHADFFLNRKIARTRARTELTWAAMACATPFHPHAKPEFCSQYDLLVLGADWYTHPWGIETPLGEVGRMLRTVAKIRNTSG